MRILLTSGGTKIPIDRVRSIRNMSRGTFGARIGTELLKMGHQVTFLKAAESRTPFSVNADFERDPKAWNKIVDAYTLFTRYRENYWELTYTTFETYAAQLEMVLRNEKPDVTILAAAVSDYGVENVVDGKIRTKENLTIQLKPLPKLIGRVKEWCPTTHLVGFKLLVDSTEAELVAAAKDSLTKNHCDFVVANDLRDIKAGQHQIILVYPGIEIKHGPMIAMDDSNYLAEKVARAAVETALRGD